MPSKCFNSFVLSLRFQRTIQRVRTCLTELLQTSPLQGCSRGSRVLLVLLRIGWEDNGVAKELRKEQGGGNGITRVLWEIKGLYGILSLREDATAGENKACRKLRKKKLHVSLLER